MNTSVRAREGTEQHGLVRRDCMPLSKLGKFRGVTKQKSAHRAVVQYLGKQVNLGCFPSPKEAAHAFDRQALCNSAQLLEAERSLLPLLGGMFG